MPKVRVTLGFPTALVLVSQSEDSLVGTVPPRLCGLANSPSMKGAVEKSAKMETLKVL